MQISKNAVLVILSIAVGAISISYFVNNSITNEKKESSNKIYNKENTKEVVSSYVKDESTYKENVRNQEVQDANINSSVNEDVTEINEPIVNYSFDNNKSNDDQMVEYFALNEQEVDKLTVSDVLSKGKDIIVKLVDFIYYDTEINGVKFNDLKQSTKDKLITIVSNIDQKLDSKLPGYKDKIKSYSARTVSFLSENLKKLITKADEAIASKVDEKTYSDTKEDFKESFDNLKEGFSNAGSLAKDVLSAGKNKLKSWYEGWR